MTGQDVNAETLTSYGNRGTNAVQNPTKQHEIIIDEESPWPEYSQR